MLNSKLTGSVGKLPYVAILEKVQRDITADILTAKAIIDATTIETRVQEGRLTERIFKYITENALRCDNGMSDNELTRRIYNDMARYGILTDLIERTDIEEININAFDDVDVIYRNKTVEKITNGFPSAKACYDIVARLLQTQSEKTIDEAKPIANAHLNKNIRICAVAGKVVDEDVGATASIRFIGVEQQTEAKLLDYNTATPDMLSFLKACINYGVSVCIGGATTAGKTSTAGYLLSSLPNDIRVVTCEEESREVNLVRRNEQGERVNSVVQFQTVPNDDDKLKITLAELLRTVLRYDPTVIFISEMRSVEANVGQEASRTGHTVLTTIHCDSAEDAYFRMVTLAIKEARVPADMLAQLIISAYPIVVFQDKLRDGSRKITQIVEGVGYENGKFKCRTLWEYRIFENVKDSDGNVSVVGEFAKVNEISEELKSRMLRKGATADVFTEFETSAKGAR